MILKQTLRWCAPHLIEAIKQEERFFTARALTGTNLPVLSDAADLMKPSEGSGMMGVRNYQPLIEAWSALQRDLKSRIEDGVCHVEAILSGDTGDTSDTHPTALSRLLASDMHFDFLSNTLTLRGQRYIAVRISADVNVAGKSTSANAIVATTASAQGEGNAERGIWAIGERPSATSGAPPLEHAADLNGGPPAELAAQAALADRRRRFPRSELVAIVRTRLHDRRGLNKDEARALVAEFRRLHPGRREPKYREVLDHVQSLYDEALALGIPRIPLD